jgi:hypothetical protein
VFVGLRDDLDGAILFAAYRIRDARAEGNDGVVAVRSG